jgi:glycine oxidase
MKVSSPDVVVIGGGVIGCVVARQIAANGVAVTLLERDVPGRAATWAAGGMLSPLGEAGDDPAFLDLAVHSLDRYPQFVSEVTAQSGIGVEYMPAGKLHIAFGVGHADLRDLLERGHGFGVQSLTGDEARALEPSLGPDIDAALLVGRDHRVNNRLLGVAAWKAAEATGVRVLCDSAAVSLNVDTRFRSVRLADGTTIAADAVVIAAGAWSGRITGLPRALPIEPVRGQMLAVAPATGAPPLERTIHAPGCYLIPREEGSIVIGATSERAGFEPGPTPGGITGLALAAFSTVPAIANGRMIETWSGFRPGTPDGLPVLGPDPDIEGVFYATGHYRNGILLAPITAEILSACVAGEAPPVPIGPFRPDRFVSH